MASLKTSAIVFTCLLGASISGTAVYAHGTGPWGQPLDWHNVQIDQVITIAVGGELPGKKMFVEGKECLAGGTLFFKVNDDYAFDIDETVWLTINFYLGSASTDVRVIYDKNDANRGTIIGGEDATKQVHLPGDTNGHWYTETIPLEHARFANLGFEATDFSILKADGQENPEHFVVCGVSLKRSYTTPIAKAFGSAAIEVANESGQLTPARLGIYDSLGHLPLPSDEAIVLKNSLTDVARVINLGGVYRQLPPWPVKNRSVFYTDGRYNTRLPAGKYELVVAKGPEYRFARRRFTVRANATTFLKLRLRRWTDMAANGWYSGEDHIHYARSSKQDDHNLLILTRAEDLKVANILQFDNAAQTYLPHYEWNTVVADRDAMFVLVPGQEAPRTTSLGHTSLLNIRRPYRDPEHYLLYHLAFENAHAQGGLAGYAHAVGPGWDPVTFEVRGMAIDVPFGVVDFAEVMMPEMTSTSIWFDFLNLGYKISPTAGTDYPFYGVPGTVRNYVRVDKSFTPEKWFDELKHGRTFVTSGPMLDISVNGQDDGSELHVRSGEPLVIKAKAALNPDIDSLASLELVEQGETVKTVTSQIGAQEMELHYNLPAKHGTWFIVRARGTTPDVVALSAPVYVLVDGQNFWKPSEVPRIVAKLKWQMQAILKPGRKETTEAWEAQALFNKYWEAQSGALKERIDQASAMYDEVAKRAADSLNQP